MDDRHRLNIERGYGVVGSRWYTVNVGEHEC